MKEQFIEKEYIRNVINASKLAEMCGCSIYCSFANDRVDLHQKICEKYGVDYNQCKKITDNFDKTIGLDIYGDYSEEELEALANKFISKLEELRRSK